MRVVRRRIRAYLQRVVEVSKIFQMPLPSAISDELAI
jgi:hypothetical protein